MTDTLGPVLQDLLAAVEDRLKECGCRAGLVTLAPGNNVVWDNCCSDSGGELWARVISATARPSGPQGCDVTDLEVRAGVGVVRCMHCLDDDGNAPSCDEMTGDTLGMTRDMSLLLEGIREWGGDHRFVAPKSLRVEQGLPLGPTGCCGGWEWTISFRLLLCGGC